MTEQEQMLTAVLECERIDLYTRLPQLTLQQNENLKRMQERRSQNEPLQYILGQTNFFGFPIKVDARVLIPRPETELLVENILEFISRHQGRDFRILDVGTGSGNIAVALTKSSSQIHVTALDISADALEVARENALANKVAHQIDFAHCDFFEFAKNDCDAQKCFDIIVSNPPYIATALLALLPADVRQEPQLALDAGEDGLKFYRVLIKQAKYFLKDGGVLACEIGDGQQDAIMSLLLDSGFLKFYFHKDYRDTPRYFLAHV